jgi:hypothetical protein
MLTALLNVISSNSGAQRHKKFFLMSLFKVKNPFTKALPRPQENLLPVSWARIVSCRYFYLAIGKEHELLRVLDGVALQVHLALGVRSDHLSLTHSHPTAE